MRRITVPCAVALGLLTTLVVLRWGPLISLDTAISDAARRFVPHHDGWRSAMSLVTHSADTEVLLPVALAVVLALLVQRRRADLLFLLGTAVTATAIRLTIMTLVHRPRPVDRLTPTSGWAFPSGHTTSSAVTAGILIVLGWTVLTRRWARLALVAVAGGWAVLVGISRVALLAHWPTDVLGGWLLAAGVTAAFATLLRVQRSLSTAQPASPQRDDGRSRRPEGSQEWNTKEHSTHDGASWSSPPASAPDTTALPPS